METVYQYELSDYTRKEAFEEEASGSVQVSNLKYYSNLLPMVH